MKKKLTPWIIMRLVIYSNFGYASFDPEVNYPRDLNRIWLRYSALVPSCCSICVQSVYCIIRESYL